MNPITNLNPGSPENPIMMCKNSQCLRVEPHAAGKSTCNACGEKYLESNMHESPCFNCGHVFDVNQSPYCPSCGLHIQQKTCVTCGGPYYSILEQYGGVTGAPCCGLDGFSRQTEYLAFHNDDGAYQITYYEEALPTDYDDYTSFAPAMAAVPSPAMAGASVLSVPANDGTEFPTWFPTYYTEYPEGITGYPADYGTSYVTNYETDYPGATEYGTPYPINNEPQGDDPETSGDKEYCTVYPAYGEDNSSEESVDWEVSAGGGAGGGNGNDGGNSGGAGQPLPTGSLGISSTSLKQTLDTLEGLTFKHITERKIAAYNSPTDQLKDALQVAIITENGHPRFTDFTQGNEGTSIDRSVIHPERLYKVTINEEDGSGIPFNTFCYEEILGNGTTIRYSTDTGEAIAIKLPESKWMTKEQWENDLRVIYHDGESSAPPLTEIKNHIDMTMRKRPGTLRQVWSRRDGLMDCEQLDEHSFTVRWYAPENVGEYNESINLFEIAANATPVKTWTVQGQPYEYEPTSAGEYIHIPTGNTLTTDDLDYLYSLTITEQRGNLTFVKRWERPNAHTLIHIKGTGEEAETTITTRLATDPVSEAELRANPYTIDGAYLKAGNTFTREIQTIVTHPGTPGGKSTWVRRYPFGDVTIRTEEGYGTEESLRIDYIYDTNTTSRTYGCLIKESLPCKNPGWDHYITYNYDHMKRVIWKTEPCHVRLREDGRWILDKYKTTYTTYCNILPNDRRIASVREYVNWRFVSWTLYSHARRPGLLENKVTRVYSCENQTKPPQGIYYPLMRIPHISYTWRYDEDHPQWPGKVYKQMSSEGILTYYFYEQGDTPECSFKMTVIAQAHGGNLTEGQTTRTIYHYGHSQETLRKQEYAYVEGQYHLIDEETYTYDLSGKLIRTDYADGTSSTATWICKGPLTETDREGITTTYHYNTAKRLTGITRQAVPIHYPAGAQVTSGTLPEETTRYKFDSAGRIIETTLTRGSCSTTTSKTLDALGRTLTETGADGATTTYRYSDTGPLLATTITTPTGATHTTHRHLNGELYLEEGTGQQTLRYQYDYQYGIERIAPVFFIKETLLLTKDNTWEPIDIVYTSGSGKELHHEHIAPNGNLIRTNKQYDTKGRLTAITSDNNEFPPVYYTYNPTQGSTTEIRHTGAMTLPVITETRTGYTLRTFNIDGQNTPDFLGHPLVWRQTEQKTTYQGDTTLPPITTATWHLATRTLPGIDAASLARDTYGNTTVTWSQQSGPLLYQHTLVHNSPHPNTTVEALGAPLYQTLRTGETLTYTYQYTPCGQTITLTDALGTPRITTYDPAGRQTKHMERTPDGDTWTYATTLWEYHPHTGLLIQETNPDGHTTQYKYNNNGQITTQYGTAVQPATFDYDNAGRLIRMVTARRPERNITTDPSGWAGFDTTTWTYHPVSGALLGKTTPIDNIDTSSSSSSSAGEDLTHGLSLTYTYDNIGRLASKTTQTATTYYTYYDNTTLLRAITHSDGTPGTSYQYNIYGQVDTITDPSGTRTFSYDNRLNLVSETLPGNNDLTLTHLRTTTGDPAGYTLTLQGHHLQQVLYHRDHTTRITQITQDNNTPHTLTYTPQTNTLQSIHWPDGSTRTLQYHPLRPIVTDITHRTRTGHTLQDETYTHDPSGRITARQQDTTRTHQYQYTPRGELSAYTNTDGATRQYTYDNIGNRITTAANNTGAPTSTLTTYTTNLENQYTLLQDTLRGSFLPQYDDEGNQTLAQTPAGEWNITWNANNRPIQFTKGTSKITCTYDYMGRRTSKKHYTNNTLTREQQYTYHGYHLIAETDTASPNNTLKTWLWNPLQGQHSTPLNMQLIKLDDIYAGGGTDYHEDSSSSGAPDNYAFIYPDSAKFNGFTNGSFADINIYSNGHQYLLIGSLPSWIETSSASGLLNNEQATIRLYCHNNYLTVPRTALLKYEIMDINGGFITQTSIPIAQQGSSNIYDSFFPYSGDFIYQLDAVYGEQTAIFHDVSFTILSDDPQDTYAEIDYIELIPEDTSLLSDPHKFTLTLNGREYPGINVTQGVDKTLIIDLVNSGFPYMPRCISVSLDLDLSLQVEKDGHLIPVRLLGSEDAALPYVRVIGQFGNGDFPFDESFIARETFFSCVSETIYFHGINLSKGLTTSFMNGIIPMKPYDTPSATHAELATIKLIPADMALVDDTLRFTLTINGMALPNVIVRKSTEQGLVFNLEESNLSSEQRTILLPSTLNITLQVEKDGQLAPVPLLGLVCDSLIFARITGREYTTPPPSKHLEEYGENTSVSASNIICESFSPISTIRNIGTDAAPVSLRNTITDTNLLSRTSIPTQYPADHGTEYGTKRTASYPYYDVYPWGGNGNTLYDFREQDNLATGFTPLPEPYPLPEGKAYLYNSLHFAAEEDFTDLSTQYSFEAHIRGLGANQNTTKIYPVTWNNYGFHLDLVALGIPPADRTATYWGIHANYYLVHKETGQRIRSVNIMNNYVHYTNSYIPVGRILGEIVDAPTSNNTSEDPVYNTDHIPYIPSITYNYVTDHNKNVVALVTPSGEKVATYHYDPFGNTLNTLTPEQEALNPFRFSSEYYDHELGLIYYNYRHYNPRDGRWLSKDPIAEQGGLNLYAFAGNDGVNYFDLLGKSAAKLCASTFLPFKGKDRCCKEIASCQNLKKGTVFRVFNLEGEQILPKNNKPSIYAIGNRSKSNKFRIVLEFKNNPNFEGEDMSAEDLMNLEKCYILCGIANIRLDVEYLNQKNEIQFPPSKSVTFFPEFYNSSNSYDGSLPSLGFAKMEKKTPSRSFMPHNGHKKIDFEVSICRDKVFKGTLTGY